MRLGQSSATATYCNIYAVSTAPAPVLDILRFDYRQLSRQQSITKTQTPATSFTSRL